MTIIICSNTKKQKRGTVSIRVGSKAATTSSKLAVSEDRMMEKAVRQAIKTQLKLGYPVARYDLALQKPYFEYPDGSKRYE